MGKETRIDALDRKTRVLDFIAIAAFVFTLIGAIFSFYYRGQRNHELKLQRDKDLVIIATDEEHSELAKRDAALAGERSELAMKDAVVAKERAAELNEKANKAELRSKELELELIRLGLAVGDRFLPANTQKSLARELKSYSNKNVIIYVNITNDSEPHEFAKKHDSFFSNLNWNVKVVSQNNIRIPAPTGIQVIATGKANRQISEIFYKHMISLNYKCVKSVINSGSIDLQIVIFAH
jgi:hypothetical protein